MLLTTRFLDVDGHRQTTKTSTTISTKRTKEHRKTEEEMEGPTFRIKEQETRLTLQEHDDDDDDDEFQITNCRKTYFRQKSNIFSFIALP